MVIVPFALYICAFASSKKKSSGSAGTTFVSNCDHDHNYMAHVQNIV